MRWTLLIIIRLLIALFVWSHSEYEAHDRSVYFCPYKPSSVCEFQWSVHSLDLSSPPSVCLAAGPCFSADCSFSIQPSSAPLQQTSCVFLLTQRLRGDLRLSALADPWLALTPEVNVSHNHHVTNETPVLLINREKDTHTIQWLFKGQVSGTLRNMIFTAKAKYFTLLFKSLGSFFLKKAINFHYEVIFITIAYINSYYLMMAYSLKV